MAAALFNKHPLNQRAKQALELARQPVDHNLVHSVQLMLWALDSGQSEYLQGMNPMLRQQVESLVIWPQEDVRLFLLRNLEPTPRGPVEADPDHDDLIKAEELSEMSPVEMADSFLGVVDDQMAHLYRDYPVINPIPEGLE